MFDYHAFLSSQLQNLKNEGRYRIFRDLERNVGKTPYSLWRDANENKKEISVWCSNDYLDMSHHPKVIETSIKACSELGAGAGGTRNISGTAHPHILLEKEIASLHNKESALLFNSGYAANEATLNTLARTFSNCIVLSDEKNHASMINGILNSKVEKYVFRHNDMDDLESALMAYDINRPKIIAVVSVYSMDGDFAPLEKLCELSEKYNAFLYVDEVHAVGIYGSQGAGLSEYLGLTDKIDIIQGNFAKAYGVIGGYISGRKNIVDYVRSSAAGFIFTTSLPPSSTMGALASVQHLRQDRSAPKKLLENAEYLKQHLKDSFIPFEHSDSHIVPVVIGNASLCRDLCDVLLNVYGIYLQPINYPTVPRGKEMVRITVTPSHTKEMIDHFVQCFELSWKNLQCQKRAA